MERFNLRLAGGERFDKRIMKPDAIEGAAVLEILAQQQGAAALLGARPQLR